jgi:4-amino-4-deoxy-L-arabinose transferase-like glycosyltransferase
MISNPRSPAMKSRVVSVRSPLWLILILGVCAIVYLAGNSRIALFDRDEGWYAQVAGNMATGGDWIVPHFGGEIFRDKPVFAFWCQAISMRVFGVNEFAARFPSVVCAILTMVVVWWAVRRFVGPRRSLTTIAVMGSSVVYMALAKVAMVDAELLLCITIAQICLAFAYAGRQSITSNVIGWIACGVAVLTKGPVVFGIIGGTMIALAFMDVGRRFGSLAAWKQATAWWWKTRPLLGVVIVAMVLGPWIVEVYRHDRAFVPVMLVHIFGPIFEKPLNNRSNMYGFYLVTIWPLFMPWSVLLPISMVRGWQNRRLHPVRFCMAATLGPLVVIELVKQKLPHYLLPLAPPIAFLIADVIVRTVRHQIDDLKTKVARVGLCFWVACILGCAVAPWAVSTSKFAGTFPSGAMTVFTGAGVTTAIVLFWLFASNRYQAAFLSTWVGSLAILLVLATIVIPSLKPLSAAKNSAAAMARAGYKPGQSVVMIGYTEPSMVFYLSGGGVTQDERYLAARTPEQFPQWLVTNGSFRSRMTESERASFQEVGSAACWNTGSVKGNGQIFVMKRRRHLARSFCPRCAVGPSTRVSLE